MASRTEKRVERLTATSRGVLGEAYWEKARAIVHQRHGGRENPPAWANGEACEEGFGPSADTCNESHCSANQQG